MIDAIITPDSSFEMYDKMIQLKKSFKNIDMTFNVAHQHHLIPDREIDYKLDEVYFGGYSLVGQIRELGLWGEILWSLNFDDNFGETVFGIDHTFDNGLFLMCEYYYNSAGANKKTLNYSHYINYYSGNLHSLMQNYLYTVGMCNLSDYIASSILMFGNLDDQSFILAPQLEWEVFEDITLSVLTAFSMGDADSEFGFQDKSVRLRVRAYY